MDNDWKTLLSNLSVWNRGSERAVHKPLLTLMLLVRAQRDESNRYPFDEIDQPLVRFLREFGPPRKSYHPEYPFWYLKNDGFWEIENPERLPTRKGKDQPTRNALIKHNAVAKVPGPLWQRLVKQPSLIQTLARTLLNEFWPDTYHKDIAQAIGLDLSTSTSSNRRDPKFRTEVLIAYERQCAICGYDARIDDNLFGIEAAHIKFKQNGGPDRVNNGIALCSIHHKAFDYGAMGLDKDLHIKVSQHLSGHSAVKDLLIRYSGKSCIGPQSDSQRPDSKFIDWHSRNVFRDPVRDRLI